MFICKHSFRHTSNHQLPRKPECERCLSYPPVAKQAMATGANGPSRSYLDFTNCELATGATHAEVSVFHYGNVYLSKSAVATIQNSVSLVPQTVNCHLSIVPTFCRYFSTFFLSHSTRQKKSYYGRINFSTSSLIQPSFIFNTRGNLGPDNILLSLSFIYVNQISLRLLLADLLRDKGEVGTLYKFCINQRMQAGRPKSNYLNLCILH